MRQARESERGPPDGQLTIDELAAEQAYDELTWHEWFMSLPMTPGGSPRNVDTAADPSLRTPDPTHDRVRTAPDWA